jgi:hypothetical protein
MSFINDKKGNAPVVVVKRDASALPQSTTGDLFSTNGRIEILGIYGEVTTAVQNQANNTKIVQLGGFSGAVAGDLCANLNVANAALGTVFTITGTAANAMVASTTGICLSMATKLTVSKGKIRLTCAASNTGEVEWTIVYRPLEKIKGSWAEVVAL